MPQEVLLASDSKVLDPTDQVVEQFALTDIVERVGQVDAVVHRVVHGGGRFSAPTIVDNGVVEALAALRSIDPTHMPQALTGISTARMAFPKCPHVLCFDTHFHASLSANAFTYAVPRQWTEEWGVRRYGFHGLSVAFVVRRVSELIGALPRRLLVCHLGSGSSITAVREGQSIDTTMGFSPLDGVPMATRSGAVDPGLLLYVLRERGLTIRELDNSLERQSGLFGLCGNGDLREVLRRSDTGDERAALSYGVWLTGLKRSFGAMLGALGGADGVVFTGGIGENQPRIRTDLLHSFAWCGIALDEHLNRNAPKDGTISTEHSRVAVFRIETREDLTMAREAAVLLDAVAVTP